MESIKIELKPGKEQSLHRFHPWLFSGAIRRIIGNPIEGDVVEIDDSFGNFIALGHYQPSSIAVRVISFEKADINKDFWRQKIEKAIQLRKTLGLFKSEITNTYRLIHGEGDNMPGLIVDLYGSTAVMQCHSVGMYIIRKMLAELIIEEFKGDITSVYDKSTGTLPFKSGINPADGYLIGSELAGTLVEHGNRFEVSWIEGQKTGFFIDQRENRRLLQEYSKGKTVLNTFGYTGGFSVYAIKGGARKAITVDSSQKAIELTRKNIELNFGDTLKHEAICGDVFEFIRNSTEKFDIIILDPPAFAKHNDALRNALQAYKRLNAAAIDKLNPGGLLFTFSCSQVVNKENFRNAVFSGCAMTGRSVKILHQLTQPADHPINIYHPEGEYLKGLVLQVE
ncbi:MAG: class I SAM-dependent rRNA methyltransferase [Bacteroidales bacterium]|nr:MAG: class I SAM-dependent rRNA methyltransferase [Bacteroidales bacterium]